MQVCPKVAAALVALLVVVLMDAAFCQMFRQSANEDEQMLVHHQLGTILCVGVACGIRPDG